MHRDLIHGLVLFDNHKTKYAGMGLLFKLLREAPRKWYGTTAFYLLGCGLRGRKEDLLTTGSLPNNRVL
jgi:hypothetical protein